jgi:hypothetical protein
VLILRAGAYLSMRLETNSGVEATEEATKVAMTVADIMKGQKADITSQEGVNTHLEGTKVAIKATEVIIRQTNDS